MEEPKPRRVMSPLVFLGVAAAVFVFLYGLEPIERELWHLAVYAASGLVFASLVERGLRKVLPDTSDVDGEWFVDFLFVNSEMEAHEVCRGLAQAGIEARPGGSDNLRGTIRFQGSGPKVLVRRRDVPRARALIEQWQRG